MLKAVVICNIFSSQLISGFENLGISGVKNNLNQLLIPIFDLGADLGQNDLQTTKDLFFADKQRLIQVHQKISKHKKFQTDILKKFLYVAKDIDRIFQVSNEFELFPD